MTSYDRREFLRRLGLGGAGAVGLTLGSWLDGYPGSWAQSESPEASPGSAADTAAAPPVMAVAQGPTPATITEAAVAALGGMARFVSPGDVVVVKPNIGWDRRPEQAANTNPEVVGTVVRLAREAGAKKVLVLDHTCNDARRCYRRSGIEEAARAAGAKVSFVEERRAADISFGGEVINQWPVFREFVEADKLINVPVVKHHTLARLSMGMKNWLGAVGGRRNAMHQEIDRTVVDLAAYFRPALTVIDAVRVLTANGPQGGNLADVEERNTVAAGTDWVAADAFGASLMGFEPRELPFIRMAEERGLGSADWESLPLVRVEES